MTAKQPAQPTGQENSPSAQPHGVTPNGQLSAGPMIGALAALAGGALAWMVLRMYYPVFGIPSHLSNLGPSATSAQDTMLTVAIAKAIRQNTMLALAVVGALVGGGLGIAEGIARRSTKAIIIGVVATAIFGGLAGGVSGLLGDLTYVNTTPDLGEPLPLSGTVLVHAVALGVLGAGIGLGLGASTGRVVAAGYCLLTGLLAGVGAGLIYPMVLAFALPGAQTQWLVPLGGGSLLLWIALIAGLLGLIVPGMAGKQPSRTVAAPATVDEVP